MERELKCVVCSQLYNNPVLLPCSHAVCFNCALHLQAPAGGGSCDAANVAADASDSDLSSLYSEADSGVVCSSRPGSYVGTPVVTCVAPASAALTLTCPVCGKVAFLDEHGVSKLPKYRLMQNIVDKYVEARGLPVVCQLCETEPLPASAFCDQCEIFYCPRCREVLHPMRGPLAKHTLLTAEEGRSRFRDRTLSVFCPEHKLESVSSFCMLCRSPACSQCISEGSHSKHDLQNVSAICKSMKAELSQNMQQLSEKARSTAEYIQNLRGHLETIEDSCLLMEAAVVHDCDRLLLSLEKKKQELLQRIQKEKESKIQALKEVQTSYAGKFQKITSLLQFCIEALKESDPTLFLQECEVMQKTATPLELTLDEKQLRKAIDQLNFKQTKAALEIRPNANKVPGPPSIVFDECFSENNTATITWMPHPDSVIDGYILELDDGSGGPFKEIYCGCDTQCTVNNLHFNSIYNAQVKSYNNIGESSYSEVVCLQTSELAWFTFDPLRAHEDIVIFSEKTSIETHSFDQRLALGNVGFSKGVHYWEFTIDAFDGTADPAFGIAKSGVCMDLMLGKDNLGWAMYIDCRRSWFLHNGVHSQRIEGGLICNKTVGVLLDLEQKCLKFYVDRKPKV